MQNTGSSFPGCYAVICKTYCFKLLKTAMKDTMFSFINIKSCRSRDQDLKMQFESINKGKTPLNHQLHTAIN